VPCTFTFTSSYPPYLSVRLRASHPCGAIAHAQLQPQPSHTATAAAEIGPEIEAYRDAHVRRQLSSRHQQHASSLPPAAAAAAAAAALSPLGSGAARGTRGARDGLGFEVRGVR
jgi:hypothetical protein